jgi:hypothetical protein
LLNVIKLNTDTCLLRKTERKNNVFKKAFDLKGNVITRASVLKPEALFLSVNFFKNGFVISPKKIAYAKYNYNISAQTIFFKPFFYQYFTDGFKDRGCLFE